jgi:hypothetical protein
MPARHLRFEITFRGSRTVVKNGQIMLPADALDSADRVAIRPFSLLAATPTSSLTRARMRMTIINWDHLIGDGEQRLRYGDAQQPCGFNSNLVDCTIGRSAGLMPLRMILRALG